MSNVMGLMRALNIRGHDNFVEVLFRCANELFNIDRQSFNTRWRRKTVNDVKTLRSYTQPTAENLFEQWKTTRDVNWLYSHPEYKWDSLGCSVYQTSQTTTSGISLLKKRAIQPKIIYDWGAGPGFSTILLAKNFQNVTVHYNEINSELKQIFEWFKEYAKVKNVVSVECPVEKYDVVQAYEIVEHIEHPYIKCVGDPILQTLKTLKMTKQKSYFLHSSCWTAENAYFTLGHFLKYQVNGKLYSNVNVNKAFKCALNIRGWKNVANGWNMRPILYEKVFVTGKHA